MGTPLPISSDVQTPYDTAIKYAKGSALALTAVALTTLVPPVAGVIGVTLAGKTVFILSSAALVSALATGGFGVAAALHFRAGYQALFSRSVKGTENEPLIKVVDTSQLENELRESLDEKNRLSKELGEKLKALDQLEGEIEALRKKYNDESAGWKESDRKNLEKIGALNEEIKKGERREEELKEEIKRKNGDLEDLSRKFEGIKSELEEKKASIIHLEQEAARLANESASKEAKLKKLEDEISEKEIELSALRAKNDEIDDYAQKNIDLERKNHELKNELEKVLKSKTDVKAADKDNEVSRLRKEKEAIEREKQDLESRLSHAQIKLKSLEKEKASIEALKETLSREKSDLEDKWHKSQEKVKGLQSEIDKLDPIKLAQEHAKKLREKDSVIAKLQSEIDDLNHSHRKIQAQVKLVRSESAAEIESAERKLKRIQEEVERDKKRLCDDISVLEKELEEEKKKASSSQERLIEEKAALEKSLRAEIDAKLQELEAIKRESNASLEEKEKEFQNSIRELRLKIQNTHNEFTDLQVEYRKLTDRLEEVSKNTSEHEEIKTELTTSKRRIQDFLKEQEQLRTANRTLKEEKENSIEILELRTKLEEAQRFNEDYQHELQGKVARVQALEKQVGDLEKQLAELSGKPLESLPVRREPTRWSVRQKELERERQQPKEVVNAGQDSKMNTYHVIPNHNITFDAVLNKFKKGEDCNDYELMHLFQGVQIKYQAECKKDKEAKLVDFRHAKQHLRNLFLDLSGDNALQNSTFLNSNVHNFLKIGIYFLDSNTLKDLFEYIRSFSTIASLNTLLEGYILRLQKGKGIAHDSMFQEVVSHYVDLCEKNVTDALKLDHSLFFEAVFYLIHKNSDIVARSLILMDRIGVMSNEDAISIYERCLSHFNHPDTNSLCIYLKERVEKIKPPSE